MQGIHAEAEQEEQAAVKVEEPTAKEIAEEVTKEELAREKEEHLEEQAPKVEDVESDMEEEDGQVQIPIFNLPTVPLPIQPSGKPTASKRKGSKFETGDSVEVSFCTIGEFILSFLFLSHRAQSRCHF